MIQTTALLFQSISLQTLNNDNTVFVRRFVQTEILAGA
jgi:hypothetical protein